jgi:hypothetical protein
MSGLLSYGPYMTNWNDFASAAPSLAAAGSERFDRAGLVLVGTIRRDGYPRISPVEPILLDGYLYLGMMHRSTKALDLHREPRCLVHSIVANKDGTDGEFKVYGRARAVDDLAERERYCVALFEKIGWRPEGDFELFAVDIEQVAFVVFRDGKQHINVWRPGNPVREIVKTP